MFNVYKESSFSLSFIFKNIFHSLLRGIYVLSDFKVHKIENMTFHEVHKWTDANHKTEISLSVKTEHDAHIFLCEENDPRDSNCYWIMLGYNKGKSSAIRKCPRGTLDIITGYPINSCKNFHVQVSISYNISFS